MRKNIPFFLFFLLSFNFLNFSNLKSENLSNFSRCENIVSKEFLLNHLNLKIKKIEIDTHNYRNWIVNNVRIITSNTRFIPNNLKKRFDAKISVTYENDVLCILKGRIRHSGDAKDHIALKDNSIIQSLDIVLDNGNIQGITRFKLFKPDVRGVLEDVVLQTQILRDFGFLAPRSFKVHARVNETNSIMLFQEKAAKELLEYNNRREGPILEGDQKFFFELVKSIPDNNLSNWSVGTPFLRNKSSKVMLSKLTNANLIKKGEVHKQISLDAVNKLNLIYLYWSNRFHDEKNNFFFFDYDLDNTLLSLFNKNQIIRLDEYNLFMQATNSHHALSAPNRKFYWNSIENYFEPIMYDANPNIDIDFSTTTLEKTRLPISKYTLKSLENLEIKLNSINIDNLHKKTASLGLFYNKEKIKKKISKIKKNLKRINENIENNLSQETISHNDYKYIGNILKNFNDNLNDIEPETYLIQHIKNDLYKCQIYLENCEFFDILDKDLPLLLEGELKIDNKNYQYVGSNLDLKNLNFKNYNKSIKFFNTTIIYDEGITIETDEEKNILRIDQKKIGARVSILNGSLENTEIIYNGVDIISGKNKISELPPNFPIDRRGLTGCLSLINLNLKNISLFAYNSNCEDTINFINSKGTVNKILVENSFRDALDVDFSKLKINKILITNALNDCVDFSYGQYELTELNLKNCGDKGISIGETSKVKVVSAYVDNAEIGIATKDSSKLKLFKGNITNSDTCISAYNKKQEFSGGLVEIKKVDCKYFTKKFHNDDFSLILLDKNL